MGLRPAPNRQFMEGRKAPGNVDEDNKKTEVVLWQPR